MAITIYEATTGALIATGERTVATYESGLVRVEQTYICASSNAATHRATLTIGSSMPDANDDPCVDGLYIFPAVQEIKRSDGFTEFRVTAYGRATTAFENYQPTVKTYITSGVYYSVYEMVGSITVRRGATLIYDDLQLDPTYADPFGFTAQNLDSTIDSIIPSGIYPTTAINWDGSVISVQLVNNVVTVGGVGAGTVTISSVSPVISVTATRNFGEFTELDILTRVRITGDGLSEIPSKA